jgi:hypothetical protein
MDLHEPLSIADF